MLWCLTQPTKYLKALGENIMWQFKVLGFPTPHTHYVTPDVYKHKQPHTVCIRATGKSTLGKC